MADGWVGNVFEYGYIFSRNLVVIDDHNLLTFVAGCLPGR